MPYNPKTYNLLRHERNRKLLDQVLAHLDSGGEAVHIEVPSKGKALGLISALSKYAKAHHTQVSGSDKDKYSFLSYTWEEIDQKIYVTIRDTAEDTWAYKLRDEDMEEL